MAFFVEGIMEKTVCPKNEKFKHRLFINGRELCPDEEMEIKSNIVFEDGHLGVKDTTYLGMYWWCRNGKDNK